MAQIKTTNAAGKTSFDEIFPAESDLDRFVAKADVMASLGMLTYKEAGRVRAKSQAAAEAADRFQKELQSSMTARQHSMLESQRRVERLKRAARK